MLNDDGYILNSNYEQFRKYKTIQEIGIDYNTMRSCINSPTIFINIFEKNYIADFVKMNLNEISLIYLMLKEYDSINFTNETKTNFKLACINNYDEIEQSVIFSIKSGYLQDKEIFLFLKDLTNIEYDLSKIRYSIRRLYKKFGVLTRSELLRSIYLYKLDTYFPKHIFKPGIYNLNFKQLQLV